MLLTVDGYKFPIEKITYEDSPYTDILIGNPSCRPRGCVEFTIKDKDPIASLQHVKFYETCSISTKRFAKQKGAMHILIKAALRWLIRTYPYIKKVTFTDESYFDIDGQNFMLPEKLFLTTGQTWYSKHFGAKLTDTKRNNDMMFAFKRAYDTNRTYYQKLPLSAWLEHNVANTLLKDPFLRNYSISGSEWYISKETIESYDISDPTVSMQGGDTKPPAKHIVRPTIKRRPRIWH